MEAFYRFCSGALVALGALFAPILPLVGCATLFIFVDFLTGVAADRARAKREGREWFFESSLGGCLSRVWVERNFRSLWEASGNGDPEGIVPYQLRHEYATRNITSWDGDAFDAHDRLLWLSRSMGHRSTKSTLHYFSLTPAISEKILKATGGRMDEIIPDPWEWEEAGGDGR
jgi:hypothetical protein